jgi:hypothetical protein
MATEAFLQSRRHSREARISTKPNRSHITRCKCSIALKSEERQQQGSLLTEAFVTAIHCSDSVSNQAKAGRDKKYVEQVFHFAFHIFFTTMLHMKAPLY